MPEGPFPRRGVCSWAATFPHSFPCSLVTPSLLLPSCSSSSSTVCAECAEDYSLGLGYTCSECDEDRRKWTTAVAVILLVAAAVAVTVSVGYLGASTKESAATRIPSLVRQRFGRSWVSQGVKIIIVSWQIVSQASGCSNRSRRISTHDPKFRMKLWNTCSVGLLKRLHLLKLTSHVPWKF